MDRPAAHRYRPRGLGLGLGLGDIAPRRPLPAPVARSAARFAADAIRSAGHAARSAGHAARSAGHGASHGAQALGQASLARLRKRLGGPARTRVIVVFACVLGLDAADLSSLGAIAGQLKPALHLTNAQLGILAAIPSLAAAAGTLPMGVLADRVRRLPILAVSIAVWASGMVLSALAGSFDELLLVRLFLGAATATAAPFVASLVGDYFPGAERARIYGYILAGELLGGGFGLLVSGNVAAVSWRVAFAVLAVPSIFIAVAVWKLLPEPARGGASWIDPGAEYVPATEEAPAANEAPATEHGPATGDAPAAAAGPAAASDGTPAAEHAAAAARGASAGSAPAGARPPPPDGAATAGRDAPPPGRDTLVAKAVEEASVRPRSRLVLDRDPTRMPVWQAVVYVLRVKTNVILIVSSSLGYFFQAGINTFAVVFVREHFGLSQTLATWVLALVALAALGGTIAGGRLADRLLRQRKVSARLLVGGVSYIVSVIAFVPGLASRTLAISIPLFMIAAATLGAPNPPLNAARLDIIPARLWGRAEAVRNVLRTLAVAAAPLLFGFLADELGNGRRVSTQGLGYSASGTGLQYAFLLMLVPMAIGGVILLRGLKLYRRDVATALASEAAIRAKHGGDGHQPADHQPADHQPAEGRRDAEPTGPAGGPGRPTPGGAHAVPEGEDAHGGRRGAEPQ